MRSVESRSRSPLGVVAVLGGGPAGLAAARELGRNGVHTAVIERAPWVGGLAMTVERDGFRFDFGGHRWFTNRPWLDRWFRDLMDGELVSVSRSSRIYFEGRYFDYPIRIPNVLRNHGVFSSAGLLIGYLTNRVARLAQPRAIETIEQAFTAEFGPGLFQMFFKNYTEKVWGRSCSELSADWVFQRTKGLSIREALLNAAGVRRSGVESLVERFDYPRLGYQRISERMREDIEAGGGRVLLRSKVVGLQMGRDRVRVRYRDPEGSERQLDAGHVISTVPVPQLVRMLDPPAPPSVMDAAKGLEFRSLVTVNLVIAKRRVTPDTWLYIHDPKIGFARMHEPRNWSAAMAPEGMTSLCTEWFCSLGDSTWRMSDAELVERTVDHLVGDLGFLGRDDVVDGFAVRGRHAYPVYTLDYGERLASLKAYVQRYADRLSLAGRGGTFRYNNADHSIEMGLLVANSLLGREGDPDSVNREPCYHEERIVEV